MAETKRLSPSMRHLRKVVRQYFSKLKSVEAIYMTSWGKPEGTIKLWVIGDRPAPQLVQAVRKRESVIRKARRDLSVRVYCVWRWGEPLRRIFDTTVASRYYRRRT